MWRRIDRNAWHTKRIVADDLGAAMTGLHVHLSQRHDFPEHIVVDHPVQEVHSGRMIHRHSLTQVWSPFRVEYDNQAHQIGFFPMDDEVHPVDFALRSRLVTPGPALQADRSPVAA